MPVDTLIRQRVADLIAADGRPQTDLAAAAGVGQKTVSAIVTGSRSDLRAEVVARIGRAVGLSPTALGRLLYDAFPAPSPGGENNPDKISDRA